jgi:hypothetical protein
MNKKLMLRDLNETNETVSGREAGRQPQYRIEIEGILDESWSEWFGGLTIESWHTKDGSIISQLTGPVADQATLRGILNKIWDLNLTLISVALVPYLAGDDPAVPPAEELRNDTSL